MASDWNFKFVPPVTAEYTDIEVKHWLIHANLASSACASIQNVFEQCRRKPLGKHAAPELCRPHADALIQCTNEVRRVPKLCQSKFDEAANCLDEKNGKGKDHTGSCAGLLEAYLACDHPVKKAYSNYK
mmetsp:Transcript_32201/g.55639  ORF Transcript_32201/g.55639 Transcript_32201/m.55639 type:complete len:129 (+) Transcript_32201:2171-2557(+)